MPEGFATVATYFSASEGAAAAVTAADVAATAGVAGGTVGTGAGVAATAATGTGIGGALATGAATAAGTAAVSSLLAPKRPDLPKPVAMPDAQAQEEARRRSIIEQTARRGRASTVLTDSGTLGG